MSPDSSENTANWSDSLAHKVLSNVSAPETTGDKLLREAQVLGGGAVKGAVAAAEKAAIHPVEAIDEILGSAIIGYGLSWAQRRTGVIGLGAEIVTLGMAAGAVKGTFEQSGWLGQVGNLCDDTWKSSADTSANQEKAASLLGQAAFDNAIMMLGGSLGAGFGRSAFPKALPAASENAEILTTSRYIPMFSEYKQYGAKSEVAALYAARKGSVVEVERSFAGAEVPTDSSYASGVVVHRPDLVATSYHVAVGSGELNVKTIDGRVVPAKMIGFDRDSDLALLRASEPLGSPVKVPKKVDNVAGEVAVFGYPSNSRKLHVSVGLGNRIEEQASYLEHQRLRSEWGDQFVNMSDQNIARLERNEPILHGQPKETVPMATFTLPSIGGYSGSGIFRTADGKLLGILARGGAADNISVATPVSKLFQLIKSTEI
jgi:Trypsin-like peptidase domain